MARWRRRSRGSRYDSYSRYPPYVPVAERRAEAERDMEALRAKGQDIQPVILSSKKIAASFWGKGWCDHLEAFSDYSNRLPRGRSYVRNGSVCHLAIKPGVIEAIVSGSRRYTITIKVKPLATEAWNSVKEKCRGLIGSMLELLQGRLSDHVMAVVSDREAGLFPQPGEIELACSCPDWAEMCKHVAAVLYGVGSRLDTQPELLFILRGVPAEELIAAQLAIPDAAAGADDLDAGSLGAIFGIELEGGHETARPQPRAAETKPAKSLPEKSKKPAKKAAPAKPAAAPKPTKKLARASAPKSKPKKTKKIPPVFDRSAPTGTAIAALRLLSGRTMQDFAADLGVSESSLKRWESTPGPLRLQTRPLEAICKLQERILKN